MTTRVKYESKEQAAAAKREREAKRRIAKKGHNLRGYERKLSESEYAVDADRKRKLARIAERVQIVTAYHASDRKIPRPEWLSPDPASR